MALMPAPKTKPVAGLPGQMANMEEWNAFTAFVTGTATKAIGFGHPVMKGAGDEDVAALATANRFIGITRENFSTGNAADQSLYADGDIIGVIDEGVIFVEAGGTVTKGNAVWFRPSDNTYLGASATGLLPLPGCEFDGSGVAGEAVPVRVRIVPGGANVTAVA